jgi:hypothetical protein
MWECNMRVLKEVKGLKERKKERKRYPTAKQKE